MASKILTIQQDAANRLIADPFFVNIPVFTQDDKDIANKITLSLGTLSGQGGKNGICAIAMTPHADVSVTFQQVFGPFFDRIMLLFRVLENRLVNEGANGTNIRALEVAEKIANRLHQYIPAGATNPLTVAQPTIILGNDPKYVSYDVVLWTSAGLTDVPPKLATPIIANAPADLFLFNYDSVGTGAPAAGVVNFDNVDPAAALFMNISKTDAQGGVVTPTLSQLVGQSIQLKSLRQSLSLMLQSMTDNGTYYQCGFTGLQTSKPLPFASERVLLWADRVFLNYTLNVNSLGLPIPGDIFLDQAAATATRARIHFTSNDGVSRPEVLAKFLLHSSFSLRKDANNHADYRVSSVVIANVGSYYELGLSIQSLTGAINPADTVAFTAIFRSMTSVGFPGASIFWDSTVANPIPRGANASLYPFSPVPFFAGDLVRATAYLAGYLKSDNS